MTREIRVEIPGRAYSVWVGSGILDRAADFIPVPKAAEVIALVTDANVAALHGARARTGLARLSLRVEEFTLTPGEPSKSAETLHALWRWLATTNLHRADLVLALGGGVVGDLAGFAASTYARGMAFVQAPTTLLGQVDAAIGGKTAIDLPEGKNLVGTFHQPRVVLADTSTLQTLPAREFATGMAEVIKHALISSGDFGGWLHANHALIDARDPATLETLVADAASVKARIVGADETEKGARAWLNYGHTLAHALEVLSEYTGYTHGEAVAIGMMFAATLAASLGYPDRTKEHRALLEQFNLPTRGASFDFDAVRVAWKRDKKYQSGMRFVVLEDLGHPVVIGDVPTDTLRAAYEAVR